MVSAYKENAYLEYAHMIGKGVVSKEERICPCISLP
jgi:hypothetical protein